MYFGRGKQPSNLIELLDERVQQASTKVAYQYPVGGGWGSMSWSQVDKRVRELAANIVDQGVRPGDRVALMSSTRVEWVLVALAILSVGAAVVAIYPQTSAEGVDYILGNSGSVMLFVENQKQLEVVLGGNHAPTLPIMLFDDDAMHRYPVLRSLSAPSDASYAVLEQYRGLISADTLATLIYTSGTTGAPKGVMLTHGNWTAEALAIAETKIVSQEDIEYCWLPFSHSFGMALLFGHIAIGFLKFIDGDPKHVVDNLRDIQPTFMAGPPRTFEKIAAGVKQRIESSDWLTRILYASALRSAKKRLDGRRSGEKYRVSRVGLAPIVFKKLSESFGGKLRLFVSGGAALSPDIAELFDLWGVPILQGYGLTETCGASVVARQGYHLVGSVGWPLPGTEVKIADPVDGNPYGEILLRGPHIMKGYFGDPLATSQVLDGEGWFHTGDLGRTERGLNGQPVLYVTGRLKEACKLSSGKYVVPEQIETRLTATGYIAHAIVVAEGRKFVSALVSLDPDNVRQWAEKKGISGDYRYLVTHPKVREMIHSLVDNEVNSGLEHWERVVRLSIVPEQFTEDNGYLTPSNKPRRHQVLRAFEQLVNEMYIA